MSRTLPLFGGKSRRERAASVRGEGGGERKIADVVMGKGQRTLLAWG